MSTIIDGTTGITFPDASTQAKAVSQVTPFAVTASAIAGAELQLPEATANGVNYVALKSADALAANLTLTLPAADGTSGQVLQTNASGTLSFGNVAAANGGTGLTSPGTAGNVLTSNGTAWTSAAGGPTLQAIATGSLANGSTAVINTDGTVSVVVGVTQSVGSATVYESAGTTATVAVYDATTQKVVIAYSDTGNSSFGTAVVGTVSGTSISFGTPVVFDSVNTGSSPMGAAYDLGQQKIVIGYRSEVSNLRYGYAVVGTVSGTSISFGTPVLLSGGETLGISATYEPIAQKVVFAYKGTTDYGRSRVGTVSGTSISFGTEVVFRSAPIGGPSITYDANAQKVVIAYVDNGNSSFGTANVGTVSGTSISFGTAVVFESASTTSISAAYDSLNQKVVIAYTDVGNTSFGTAIVGTVSGTSISFGTAVVFRSATTASISAAYDATAQKVVIAYQDGGNSSFGTAIAGIVSGTSIIFNTATVFESASSSSISATYNSANQKVVIAYADVGNSSFGTSVVFQTGSTNLTSENFIGFSNAAYTNGQTATIQIIGAVDDAQSGLTAGQSYFVQNDGLLGLTASFPSVFAGTAVAANKIIVKG
jgi:hypothetical protein